MSTSDGANETDRGVRPVEAADPRRDGLAAVAITLLAAALIAFLIVQIV